MTMNILDHDLERAETQAGPEQFLSRSTTIDRNVSRGRSIPGGCWASPTQVVPPNDLTELQRSQTRRSQQLQTVGSKARTRSSNGHALPGFGAGKPYPPQLRERENYVVEFNGGDDPLYPQNWSLIKK
jgi:DHA1 family multidrug resistance protein-like MFS transporter